MKKIFVFVLSLILLPTFVNALEYSVELSGKDYLYSKHKDEALNSWTMTSLYIDINNFDNVGSFTMYVSYDSEIVGLSGCSTFNFIAEGCSVTSFDVDKKIYYNFKYNNAMDDDIPNYHFYTVTFKPKDNTPKSGTTEVVVSFSDAKDREGNPITIESATKKYTFKEWKLVLNSEDNKNGLDENKDNAVNNNVVDNNSNVKSNNNYISQMIVYGYKINFDKNKTDYEIILDNDINKLDIDIYLDSDNASYEIIGNDNLKNNNNNVILINVKAENGDIKTYKINTKRSDDNNTQEIIDVSDIDTKEDSKINKEQLYMILGIGIGLIILIILIISLVSHRSSKKIDKMLDDL